MANYGDKGWIKLWRSEMHNPLYNAEPFTKWQAYIDLRMLADDQGTVRTSLEALKNRWLWGSRHKVRDLLETVEGTGLGTVKTTKNKGTLIRLNTGFSASRKTKKKATQGTVEGTVSGLEEVLPKEVVGGSSLGTTPPNNYLNNNNSDSNYKSMEELLEELGDEYE